jgi:hypothetical protein
MPEALMGAAGSEVVAAQHHPGIPQVVGDEERVPSRQVAEGRASVVVVYRQGDDLLAAQVTRGHHIRARRLPPG